MPDLAAVEAVVLSAVAGTLELAEVSASDNFFDLGGDSLAALAVASAVEQELGGEVPLEALFDATDLHAYAEVVTATVNG